MFLSLGISVTSRAQPSSSPNEDQVCFSKEDAQDILKKLKELSSALELIAKLKDLRVDDAKEITTLNEKISLLNERMQLMNEKMALKDEKYAILETALKLTEKLMQEYKEYAALKEKEANRAKLFGMIEGLGGIIIGIVALLVAL